MNVGCISANKAVHVNAISEGDNCMVALFGRTVSAPALRR